MPKSQRRLNIFIGWLVLLATGCAAGVRRSSAYAHLLQLFFTVVYRRPSISLHRSADDPNILRGGRHLSLRTALCLEYVDRPARQGYRVTSEGDHWVSVGRPTRISLLASTLIGQRVDPGHVQTRGASNEVTARRTAALPTG